MNAPESKRAPGHAADAGSRLETRLVRGGLARSGHDETSEALFLTSGYVYGAAEEAEAAFKGETDRFVYSRYGSPTVAMFEERLRLIEGAEACMATSSGMAAVWNALLSQLKAGDRLVSSRALFGSCHHIVDKLLPRFGVETVFVDGRDLDDWAAALSKPTRCVFLETPSNPMLELVDLQVVSALAHGAGAKVVVDNVFATPLLQKPIELGADIVVYSATKHIDGQGRTLGGAVLGSRQMIEEELQPFIRHTGPALSPFNAWVLLKGLETLKLRVEAQCASALRVAQFLEAHPAVELTLFPGLDSHPQVALARSQMTGPGTLVTFEVPGGRDRAFQVLNALRVFDISNNLGDSKSLATHPASTTHLRIGPEERAKLGVRDGVLRLSIGLEDIEDLLADLDQALAV